MSATGATFAQPEGLSRSLRALHSKEGLVCFRSIRLRMHFKFSADNSTHSAPYAAVVAVQVVIVRIEVEVTRVVRIVLIERTRQVAAIGASVVE